jgi:hypothetical protein
MLEYRVSDAAGNEALARRIIEVTGQRVIRWDPPDTIPYGTPLSSLQLNATATVPGRFIYDPAPGTILHAGDNQVLATAFYPDGKPPDQALRTKVLISVKKALLIVSVEDVIRRVNTPNPDFEIQYEGFVNGEDKSVLESMPLATTAATQSSPTGEYAIEIDGGMASNYEINHQAGRLKVVDKVDAVIRLVIRRSDAGIVLEVLGPDNELVILQSTDDFLIWQDLGGLHLNDGKAILSVPLTAPVQVFRGKR